MSEVIALRPRFGAPVFTLQNRMVKARETAGMTQDRMAQLLGCSSRTIVRYETKAGNVPPAVIMAYSVACEVDLAWLYTGTPSWDGGAVPWYTPRDLNPEPTDSEAGNVTPIDWARSMRWPLSGGSAA